MSGSDEKLRRYREKRDFARTSEPSGKRSGGGSGGQPLFVIQHHRASTEHYDFRLEVDGVLESWVVPKGPSTDPREKRLAVRVEEHPLDYADFEGVIAEGEYGAGAVIVWDRGTYRNLKRNDDKRDDGGREMPMPEALEKGTVEVWLEGEKLRGGYALVHAEVGGDADNWLLIKMNDEGADARRNPTSTEPESVLSGKTVEEMAEEMERAGAG